MLTSPKLSAGFVSSFARRKVIARRFWGILKGNNLTQLSRRISCRKPGVNGPCAGAGDQQENRAEQHCIIHPCFMGHAPEAVGGQFAKRETPESMTQKYGNFGRDNRH